MNLLIMSRMSVNCNPDILSKTRINTLKRNYQREQNLTSVLHRINFFMKNFPNLVDLGYEKNS